MYDFDGKISRKEITRKTQWENNIKMNPRIVSFVVVTAVVMRVDILRYTSIFRVESSRARKRLAGG
jgi:hypothetical protein